MDIADMKSSEDFAKLEAEDMLRKLDDEAFKLAMYATATLFSKMKTEAIRRGIWEEVRGVQL